MSTILIKDNVPYVHEVLSELTVRYFKYLHCSQWHESHKNSWNAYLSHTEEISVTNFPVTWATCLFRPPCCSKHCHSPCCHHTFTMTSVELTKSIPDIDTQYSLALADLNSNSSVSLCEVTWIYDLSWFTLQAQWKERWSAKTFYITQQQLSVHEKNALIQ